MIPKNPKRRMPSNSGLSDDDKQTCRRQADTSGFDNGHRNANCKPLVPRQEQSVFTACVRNRTHRHRLSKRSTEPEFNRHPEKTDRY
jgi:hypothetical protein